MLVLTLAALVYAKSDRKRDVAVKDIPAPVLDAARQAVAGLQVTEAEMRQTKAGTIYEIEGDADGAEYEVRVRDNGQVLGVKRDDDGHHGGKDIAARGNAAAGDGTADSDAAAGNERVKLVGTLRHEALRESSGIAASRRHAGVFWTHNDKGNDPVLYAIDRSGTVLAQYPVAASDDDWEDVALDDQGRLYIGNIGNNKAKRDTLEVHRLAEPNPQQAADASGAALQIERTWRLTFPGSPFDCESLFIREDKGFVISKLRNGGPAAIYRFSLDGAGDQVLEKVCELPVRTPVTAADLSTDGTRLAVLSEAGLHVVAVEAGDLSKIGDKPELIPLPARKLEGVCFTSDGILLTAESREVFFIAR